MADGFTPRDGDFVRELLGASVIELAGHRPEPVERFTLRAWSDGYFIYDRGEVICTFHGPQWGLASKTLRLLRDETKATNLDGAV